MPVEACAAFALSGLEANQKDAGSSVTAGSVPSNVRRFTDGILAEAEAVTIARAALPGFWDERKQN